MSETAKTQEQPATGEETNATTQEQPAPEVKSEEQLGDAGKRALEAERKARKAAEKAAAEAAAKVKQYEDANKSELEKLQEESASAKQRAGKTEQKLLRLEAALDAGLPRSMADRLRGNTSEELAADAEALKGVLGQTGGGATPPPGSFDGGARKPVPEKPLDQQIAEAEKAGDTATALTLKNRKLTELAGF